MFSLPSLIAAAWAYLATAFAYIEHGVKVALRWLLASEAPPESAGLLDYLKAAVGAFLASSFFVGFVDTIVRGAALLVALPLPWYLHWPLFLISLFVTFLGHLAKLRATGPADPASVPVV